MSLFGDLFEASGFSGLLASGKWVTLSSGSRVKLDAGGRVVTGLPYRFHGTHVRDLPTLFRREREIGSVDCAAEKCHDCPATFKDKAQAVAALLEANPDLRQLLESDGGAGSVAYRAWAKHGRRGRKPQLAKGDGRFDALNERWELRGVRAVSSWLEAVYVTIPTSRQWADLEIRLVILEEAAGFKVWMPAEAERAAVGELSAEECRARVDEELDRLFESARVGRLDADAAGGAADVVPF